MTTTPASRPEPRRFLGDESDLMSHVATNRLDPSDLQALDALRSWLDYAESSSPAGLRFLAAEARHLSAVLTAAARRAEAGR